MRAAKIGTVRIVVWAVIFRFAYLLVLLYQDPSDSVARLKDELYRQHGPFEFATELVGQDEPRVIHIAVVACGAGHRIDEVFTMIKSAALLSDRNLNFIVFTDQRPALEPSILRIQDAWRRRKSIVIDVEFHEPDYPDVDGIVEMIDNGWGRCAGQKLFFPSLLSNSTSSGIIGEGRRRIHRNIVFTQV